MVIETKHRQRITAGACGLLPGLLPGSTSSLLLSVSLMLVALSRTLLYILTGLTPVLPILLSVLLMSVLLLSVLLVHVSVLSLMAMLLMRVSLVRLPLTALLMMLAMLLMLTMVQKRLLLGHRLGISKLA